MRIGLDDFGTGQSSLGYLKRFPLDFVKIDRSLVAGLGLDEHDTAIVRATIELAHNLGLVVIAVGVETEEQLEALGHPGLRPGPGLPVRPGAAGRAAAARLRRPASTDRPGSGASARPFAPEFTRRSPRWGGIVTSIGHAGAHAGA